MVEFLWGLVGFLVAILGMIFKKNGNGNGNGKRPHYISIGETDIKFLEFRCDSIEKKLDKVLDRIEDLNSE